MKSTWKKVSIVCGIIGLCCIIAAGLFAFYNMYDDARAAKDLKNETEMLEEIILTPGKAATSAPEQIVVCQPTPEPIAVIQEHETAGPDEPAQGPDEPAQEPAEEPTPGPTAVPEYMPVVTIDGWDFVAIISIPALDLEFCVRNEWTKEGGKQSP